MEMRGHDRLALSLRDRRSDRSALSRARCDGDMSARRLFGGILPTRFSSSWHGVFLPGTNSATERVEVEASMHKKDRSMAVLVGIVHSQMGKLWRLALLHPKHAERVVHFRSANFDPQIDGRDEMLRRERGAILSHHFESRLAWNEENEASRFALGAGLAEPAVAQLTTERYQSEPPRWAGVIRKGSTDPSKPGRGFFGKGLASQ
jgi:hypothetical protein